jgi:hypothetical protein
VWEARVLDSLGFLNVSVVGYCGQVLEVLDFMGGGGTLLVAQRMLFSEKVY